MDWKLFLSAFTTILVAELGDKTQLATLALASSKGGRLAVFAGAALALAATSALAVLGGGVVGRLVPEAYVRKAAGLLFVLLGAYYLFAKNGG